VQGLTSIWALYSHTQVGWYHKPKCQLGSCLTGGSRRPSDQAAHFPLALMLGEAMHKMRCLVNAHRIQYTRAKTPGHMVSTGLATGLFLQAIARQMPVHQYANMQVIQLLPSPFGQAVVCNCLCTWEAWEVELAAG